MLLELLPLLAALQAPPAAVAAEAGGRAQVALTFDDLPAHGALPPGRSRLDVVRGVLEALRAAEARDVYGFLNARTVAEAPENADVLRAWVAAGHSLGNHSYSHLDLHQSTPEEFGRDVRANEPLLRELMGDRDWRWFRYPYLHEGETIEKRRAALGLLQEQRYRVAQVTVNFDDWAFHDPYARCLARDDRPALSWLRETYLAEARASLDWSREAARRVFGRDIRHVLLLHVGDFNTVMLPDLLALLRERGFELVSLDEAHRDPAYSGPPDLALPQGATLLDRWLTARAIPRPPAPESPLRALSERCR